MDGGGWSVESAEDAAAANMPWPHEGLKLFCNFSCDDMLPSNGSTECWCVLFLSPGAHSPFLFVARVPSRYVGGFLQPLVLYAQLQQLAL
jgi:hypothetical protein